MLGAQRICVNNMACITFEVNFSQNHPYPSTDSLLVYDKESRLVTIFPIESLLNCLKKNYEWTEYWVELQTAAGESLVLAHYVADKSNRWSIEFQDGGYPLEHQEENYYLFIMDHRPSRLLDLIFKHNV